MRRSDSIARSPSPVRSHSIHDPEYVRVRSRDITATPPSGPRARPPWTIRHSGMQPPGSRLSEPPLPRQGSSPLNGNTQQPHPLIPASPLARRSPTARRRRDRAPTRNVRHLHFDPLARPLARRKQPLFVGANDRVVLGPLIPRRQVSHVLRRRHILDPRPKPKTRHPFRERIDDARRILLPLVRHPIPLS